VRSGWVAQGPRVARFEAAFAERVGAAHGVAVSSCTTGLHLALIAVGVQPGDEVIVPSLSFIATANAVRYAGATPVFADVELATGNVTVETIDRVRTARTRAVIAVHQGGVPLDLRPLRTATAEWGVALVEDAISRLAAIIARDQERGALRSDLDPRQLARMLLALVIGAHTMLELGMELDVGRLGGQLLRVIKD